MAYLSSLPVGKKKLGRVVDKRKMGERRGGLFFLFRGFYGGGWREEGKGAEVRNWKAACGE